MLDLHLDGPLFLTPEQTFVNGVELKEDLKKLDERYSALEESEFKTGTTSFAMRPPEEPAFLPTRLWDKHVPKWRDAPPPVKLNKQLQDALTEMMKKVSGSPQVAPHDIGNVSELGYVSVDSKIHLRKGKYRRYSEEMEQRIIEGEKNRMPIVPHLACTHPAGRQGDLPVHGVTSPVTTRATTWPSAGTTNRPVTTCDKWASATSWTERTA